MPERETHPADSEDENTFDFAEVKRSVVVLPPQDYHAFCKALSRRESNVPSKLAQRLKRKPPWFNFDVGNLVASGT